MNTITNTITNTNTNKRCLKLTRFLYPKDEVELSFMISLLSKEPCETCLFWACELIYSGFDISALIWSIYYDFYAQLNPSLFKKVASSFKKLRNGNIEPVLMLIKTLRVKKATDNVFSLRISQTPTKLTIYRGRVPNWLSGFPVKHRPLLRAICNYNWGQILLYVRQKVDKPKELIKSVIKVMTEKNIIQQNDKSALSPDEEIVESLWDNHGYEDETHIMLALIVSLVTPDTHVDFGSKMIKLNDDEKMFINKLNANEDNCHMNLLCKRLYKVSPYVGAFDIARFSVCFHDDNISRVFSKEIANYLPYHCSETPYWKNVFKNYGVVVGVGNVLKRDYNSSGLLFNDDAKEEAFEKLYGFLYDLDEPFMMSMWKETCGEMELGKDIVDVMEDLFGSNNVDDNNRIEFENIELSSERKPYVDGDIFDFTALNKILDSLA